MDDWLKEVSRTLDDLSESLASIQLEHSAFPSSASLKVPSVKDLVEIELTRTPESRSVDELREVRDAQVKHLECVRLNALIEKSKKLRASVSQRTPASNSLRPPSPDQLPSSNLLLSTEDNTCIFEFDVYGNRWTGFTSSVYGLENRPEALVKFLTLEISGSATFGQLYDRILAVLPGRRSYEASVYSHGGMFVFGSQEISSVIIFTDRRGGENFCDYSQYVDSPGVTVHDMDEAVLGVFSDKIFSPSTAEPHTCMGYLVHTGNQIERIYLANVRIRGGKEEGGFFCREKYRRSVRKISWCVLCGSRVAQLAVVDDQRLPHTPCFVCKDCYRIFRSDETGAFIDPEEHVGVFLFHEF